jgi:hypothetical protein
LARTNYRQMKKQKEAARKTRQVEKLQRRQTKGDQPGEGEAGEGEPGEVQTGTEVAANTAVDSPGSPHTAD